MSQRYSEAFKEQAISKVLQRGDKTIQCIADELNVNLFTLKNWLKKPRTISKPPVTIIVFMYSYVPEVFVSMCAKNLSNKEWLN